MRVIPEVTEVTLSAEERRDLEALSRSTKSQTRMRFRARVVLLAAEGTATREISRRLRCTIGTASKWRVRYARDRLAGLAEVGNRGAVAKYGAEHSPGRDALCPSDRGDRPATRQASHHQHSTVTGATRIIMNVYPRPPGRGCRSGNHSLSAQPRRDNLCSSYS
jgi:hypothetical protein